MKDKNDFAQSHKEASRLELMTSACPQGVVDYDPLHPDEESPPGNVLVLEETRIPIAMELSEHEPAGGGIPDGRLEVPNINETDGVKV
jgi:hypothetical protein